MQPKSNRLNIHTEKPSLYIANIWYLGKKARNVFKTSCVREGEKNKNISCVVVVVVAVGQAKERVPQDMDAKMGDTERMR